MPTTRSQARAAASGSPGHNGVSKAKVSSKRNGIGNAKARARTKIISQVETETATLGSTPKKAQAKRTPISNERFGLIQEQYKDSLYALVIQAILWNQTTGRTAKPVLASLLSTYPTPIELASASLADLTELLYPIGLYNQRAKRLIKLAQIWVETPPCKERRYVRRDYPKKGDGREAKVGEVLNEDDDREGWEIAHLPGVGPYALDSYRIFYRDTLREVKGKDGVEPEWKRVTADDKDLKPYLVWRWERNGFIYDAERGRVLGPVDKHSGPKQDI